MIINCSMRYSPSGRKRKTNAYKKKAQPKFVAQDTSRREKNDAQKKHEEKVFGSIKTTKYVPEVDNSWKLEESKKFTVAPAYNKGAYQVIPRGDVEWIGK